jgi:hypothetical protein
MKVFQEQSKLMPKKGSNMGERKDIQTVLIVNPASSGGSIGKGWDELISKIKETASYKAVKEYSTSK